MNNFRLLLSEPRARVLELAPSGEVDLATVTPLREATRTAVASHDYDWLVFDLSGVTFMDSSGLHVLAEANAAMTRDAGGIRVICGPGHVRKVFELTGLDRVLPIFSERSEALTVAA
ncbi:MAG TPA: STAS domain-containing protein [Thermoleophilaceae bacterium]|jgi:anti-sigma B factor antagonist|nr:STAS domain-containing protein [Thermoleophilaceae bacterium]